MKKTRRFQPPATGKRDTAQRRLILDAVRELGNHPTAEQVFEHVSRRCPSIGKATVYRNLSRMAEAGEVLNAGVFSGSARYDHTLRRHCHFSCASCGRIFDVEGDFSDICGRVGGTDGFDIESCAVSFSGLCWSCKAARASAGAE